MRKLNATAKLTHDAKRCYVFAYGVDEMDGKITISKRILNDDDIDYVEALENGDIEIVNESQAAKVIDLMGIKVDEEAVCLVDAILQAYADQGKMPEKVN